MFKVQWSPQGSNQKESEEAVILGWNKYVHDLEGMLLHSDYKTILYPSFRDFIGCICVFNILLRRKYLAFDFLNIHAGYTYSPNVHLS